MRLFKRRQTDEVHDRVANLEAEVLRVVEAATNQLRQDMDDDVQGFSKLSAATGSYDLATSDLKEVRRRCLELWRIDSTLAQTINLLQGGTFGGVLEPPQASTPGIQAIVDEFWLDSDNQLAAFGRAAQESLNTALVLEGERFFTMHTSKADHCVKLSFLPPDEITQVLPHPTNRLRPVLYERRYRSQIYNFEMKAWETSSKDTTVYYLDAAYGIYWSSIDDPTILDDDVQRMIQSVGDGLVDQQCISHVKVNTLGRRGIPEAYRAYDWAKAHDRALSSLVTMAHALAALAWRQKVATTSVDTVEKIARQWRETPPGPGAVKVENTASETVPVSAPTGAVSNLDVAARQTLLQQIRSFGFGEHWYADASSGKYTTASNMELPAIWRVEDRQQLFREVYSTFCQFAMARVGQVDGGSTAIPEAADQSLDFNFPPAQPRDPATTAQLLAALSTALIDPREAAYQSYVALGSDNIGDLLDGQFPDMGTMPAAPEVAEVERRLREIRPEMSRRPFNSQPSSGDSHKR